MEHFFFGQESHQLFGVLVRPAGRARTGLVFCPPFGEEMVSTYARFARWSKELADRGFAVLRYHPRGTGESHASLFTLDSAAQDAATAVRWLREHGEVDRVGIFGLRFGASVAVNAAAQADFLVFWSPIINLRLYFRDLLRLRMTKEMIHRKADRVNVTTKDLTSELEAGRSIDLLGYEASPELYRQMTSSTSWPDEPPAPDVLWLGLPSEQGQAEAVTSAWKDRGCRVDVEAFREPFFWEDFNLDFPHQFAESSIAWMERKAAEAPGVR
jgi:exosortase A-associated hydrolase 2